MMQPDEYAEKAEIYIKEAGKASDVAAVTYWLGLAQVYSTLALASATDDIRGKNE